jgi:hypothetical protein
MQMAVKNKRRAKKLNVGGSGRVSPFASIENELCGWIKDERREERPVSMDCIIDHCMVLLPGFIENKSATARKSWCSKFMRRNGLTIRRISHSGRKKHSELLVLRDAFACEVTKLLVDHFLDASTASPPPYTLYNMDQNAVYCDVGSKTTVDFVGVTRVPAHGGGKGGYRCTAALLVCADGRMLPPHFVFAGEPDNDVYYVVQTYCEPGVATFSVQTKA